MTKPSKIHKSDNFELHSSPKLNFTNIRGFVLTQLVVNLSSKETLLKFFLYVRQTLKIQYILVISLCGFSPSNSKGFCYSYECFCSLCEGETSGCYSEILEDDISKELGKM